VLLGDAPVLRLAVGVGVAEGVGVAVLEGVGGMHALSVTEPLVPDPPLTVLRPTNVAAVNVTSPVLA